MQEGINMAEQDGIYKCNTCGNVVSVIEAYPGVLVCCGKDMNLLQEKTSAEEGKEKHVPIIETFEKGVRVKVGSVPHPMEKEHYIELIQLTDENGIVIGKRLKPGDKPEVEFCCVTFKEGLKARALCNIHGLWRSK